MTTLHYDLKPFSWLSSRLSSWLSILLLAAITSACGGDQGRQPILGLPSATIVALNLSPQTASVAIGGVQQYIATASFADGSSRVVTTESSWTSTVATTVSVSTTGLAKGLVGGTTTINASYLGKVATASLVVMPSTLISIALTPSNSTIANGGKQTFRTTGTYSDGSTADITANANFTTSIPTIASILPTGVATGLSVGTTAVVTTSNGFSATTNLIVSPAVLLSISMTPSNPNLQIGSTQQLILTANYTDGTTVRVTDSAAFTSATPAVTTVGASGENIGFITGMAPGTSVVSAVFNGLTTNTTVTVVPAALVSISVTPATASILVGAKQAFIATGTYSDGSLGNVSTSAVWTSSDLTKASVLPGGLASGLSAGVSTMTAALASKSGTAQLTVAAIPTLISISVTPGNSSAAMGATQQFTAIGTYSDASTVNLNSSVNWSSSNVLVATIGNTAPKGLASALTTGVTVITATQAAISNSTNFTVTAAIANNINLGAASNFGVLAGSSITNNVGGTSLITGDVGAPTQVVDPMQVSGFTNYKTGTTLSNALADLQLAITDANARPCTVTSALGIELGGLTLTPGVYCYAGPIGLTGTFTMNGSGLYVFRTSSTLTTGSNSIVALSSGASSGNVFWVPSAATTLGNGSAFIGSILAKTAAISVGDMATLQNGRVLSASTVNLKNNVITR
jgi:hypothetical protein